METNEEGGKDAYDVARGSTITVRCSSNGSVAVRNLICDRSDSEFKLFLLIRIGPKISAITLDSEGTLKVGTGYICSRSTPETQARVGAESRSRSRVQLSAER